MKRAAFSGLVAAVTLGVAACHCVAPESRDADGGRDAPSVRHDTLPADRGPDLLDPAFCGGSRTRVPRRIARKPTRPLACTVPGCVQVTHNRATLRFEVKDDLLVASVGQPSRVHYVELKTGQEWLRSEPRLPGCEYVATDGQLLAYACGSAFTVTPTPGIPEAISVFDPSTRRETDLSCFTMRAEDDSCVPQAVALGTTGVVLNMSFKRCRDRTRSGSETASRAREARASVRSDS